MGVDVSKLKRHGPGDDAKQIIKLRVHQNSSTCTDVFGAWSAYSKEFVKDWLPMSFFAAIPHVTHMDEFDASALVKAVTKSRSRKKGIKLTYLAYIMKAAAEVLKKYPALNASLTKHREVLQNITILVLL